ncbi:uncharacterized protein [Typha latifolia]|uniref:uncharacterized protein n=1 Tax=Typha latifolia TaxID=4733 RepID=UPI003C2D937B
MPRKRNPILGRALDFIALSITPMAKFKRPITRKLLLFKKAKRLKLFRHYHYAYIGAYEFSPSNTPLFYRPWDSKKKKKSRILSLLLCGGDRAVSVVDGGRDDELEVSSASGDGVERDPIEMAESGEDDEVSVDRRAERFIERFYEEMRIQRQESLEQYKEMLRRSC